MQISPRTGQIVEKIVRDHDGRLVRATFYIYQSGTRVRARLIKSEFIQEAKQLTAKVLALPKYLSLKTIIKGNIYVHGIISPFFTVNQLYFLGSKPRAPSNF